MAALLVGAALCTITDSMDFTQVQAVRMGKKPAALISSKVEAMPERLVSIPPKPVPDRNAWNLLLVNPWNTLPEGFTVQLAVAEDGYKVDTRIVAPLRRMLEDCRAAGLKPLLCSAYRTYDYQVGLFDRQIRKQKSYGLVGDAAVTAAAQVVARPNTSEHQTGLAVDIFASHYQVLNRKQENTPEYQWLKAHCADYGFIVRYPDGATDITGIIYEPWHFRYVGEEAAQEIMSEGITLEEYLQVEDRR